MENELARKDLLKYYNHVMICSVCGKEYGSDKKRTRHQNKRCPMCCNYVRKNWGGISLDD